MERVEVVDAECGMRINRLILASLFKRRHIIKIGVVFCQAQKITLNARETIKYQFGKLGKQQNDKSEPNTSKYGCGWRRLTLIANKHSKNPS